MTRFIVFGVALIALAAAALATGSQIYYLLLLTMLMILAVGLVSVVMALLTVQVRIEAPQRKFTRGGIAPLKVFVRYMGLLPVRSMQLILVVPEDERAEESLEIDLVPLVERSFTYELACPHRGVYHVGVAGIRATDIFNMFSFKRRLSGTKHVVEVRPRATKLLPMELSAGESEASFITRMTEDTASPSDVRQYRLGDPLKRVHWKLSIRKRELLVRTYEESSRPDTLILLDLSPINTLRSQALAVEDLVCETGASIAMAQLQAGYPVRMPLMSSKPQEPSGKNALEFSRFQDALMRVKFDSPYPYEQVLMLEMRRIQRTGGVVMVTPRLTPRMTDIALQFKRYGMKVAVCLITEARRSEALQMLDELAALGVNAHRIDPYDGGIAALGTNEE